MPMVVLGVLLAVAKWAGLSQLADVAWWWFLAPFAAAAAWWAVADATGITQRRAMQKMEDRKADRRDRALSQLGLDTRRKSQADKSRSESQRRSATVSSSAGNRPGASKDPRL